MTDNVTKVRWAPAVALFALAPFFGEVVGAALRLSYFTQPLRLVAVVAFYGAGVVLIREVAHRRQLHWSGLVLLGIAFGVLEEGLMLWTIFNPVGMDGEGVFGRAIGVNWVWAVVVCGYHVVWSVMIPIAVARLAFPAARERAWLTRRMLVIISAVFLSSAGLFTLISFLRSDFRPSWIQVGEAVILVAVLAWAGLQCTAESVDFRAGRVPRPLAVGLFGLLTGLVWFALYVVALTDGGVSFVWWAVGAGAFALVVAAALARWCGRDWTDGHALALCFGAVLAAAVFGTFLVLTGGVLVDVVFQVAVVAGIVVGYVRLRSNKVVHLSK